MAQSLNLSPRTRELLEKIQAITVLGNDKDTPSSSSSSNKEPLLHLYVHLLEVISVLQEIDDAVKVSDHELIRTISENKYNDAYNKPISKEEINDLNFAILPALIGAIGRGFAGLLLNDFKDINDSNEDIHDTEDEDNKAANDDIINEIDALVNKDKSQALTYIFREEIARRFPNILSRRHRATGQTLLHYVAEKAKSGPSARQSIDLLLEYTPKEADMGAYTKDNFGALPLHWATRNSNMSMDFLHGIIAACPEAPMTKDDKGYLPIHWAVSVDKPDIYTIGLLLSIHPAGAASPCVNGNLPLHIAVNRQNASAEVVSALLHIFPEAASRHCKKGWLPIHRCVNRPSPNPQVVKILLDVYPKGLQLANVHLSLPLHCITSFADPSVPIVQKLIDINPASLSIADGHGYLPLHCIIDNYNPNTKLAISVLQQYPEAAATKTKEGFLPLHLIISSNRRPDPELVELLLEEYPDAMNYAVEDRVPDTNAEINIDEYKGPWKSHTRTPLVMAIERNLVQVISIIKQKMKSMKATAIDVRSIDNNTETDAQSVTSIASKSTTVSKSMASISSRKFNSGRGAFNKSRGKVAIDIVEESDNYDLGSFGENLRGSIDSIDAMHIDAPKTETEEGSKIDDSDNGSEDYPRFVNPRLVKKAVTLEPLSSSLKPLSRQLKRTGMVMDNVAGGITLVSNKSVPQRLKLAPLRQEMAPSREEVKSMLTNFEINEFGPSLDASESNIKVSNSDDDSISSNN